VRSQVIARRGYIALGFALLVWLCLLGVGSAEDSGHQVRFIKPLTPELLQIAEAYYLNDPYLTKWYQDIEKRAIPLDDLGGAFADIDDDGQPEAIFQEGQDFGTCGTVGCEVRVLKKVGNQWRLMGSFDDGIADFTILPEKDHGVHRILSYSGHDNRAGTVIWDGREFH